MYITFCHGQILIFPTNSLSSSDFEKVAQGILSIHNINLKAAIANIFANYPPGYFSRLSVLLRSCSICASSNYAFYSNHDIINEPLPIQYTSLAMSSKSL